MENISSAKFFFFLNCLFWQNILFIHFDDTVTHTYIDIMTTQFLIGLLKTKIQKKLLLKYHRQGFFLNEVHCRVVFAHNLEKTYPLYIPSLVISCTYL